MTWHTQQNAITCCQALFFKTMEEKTAHKPIHLLKIWINYYLLCIPGLNWANDDDNDDDDDDGENDHHDYGMMNGHEECKKTLRKS
jgi:hypothetical protein